MEKQLYLSRTKHLQEEVTPVRNHPSMAFLKKPIPGTGLWTSTWREDTRDSAWTEWCFYEDFDEPLKKYWWLLIPRKNCHIYTINTLNDLHHLLASYRLDIPAYRHYGDLGLTLDFERLSQDYDGLWLTEEGQQATHLSHPCNLYGWDAESTLWFRWCFEYYELIYTPLSLPKESET